jgi:hypothetical protein
LNWWWLFQFTTSSRVAAARALVQELKVSPQNESDFSPVFFFYIPIDHPKVLRNHWLGSIDKSRVACCPLFEFIN